MCATSVSVVTPACSSATSFTRHSSFATSPPSFREPGAYSRRDQPPRGCMLSLRVWVGRPQPGGARPQREAHIGATSAKREKGTMGAGTPLTYAIGDIHGRLDLLRIRGELTAAVSRSATEAVGSHSTRLISP